MSITQQDVQGLSSEQIAERYSLQEIEDLIAQATPKQAKADEGIFDITPFDPNADFMESAGTALSNVPGSAVNLGKDVFNAVTNPIDTAKGLIEAGPSGILSALGERFGSIDALKKTAVEDPFGLALDVAPGLQAVGAGAKAAGIGGRVASGLAKANPLRAGAAVATKTASVAAEKTGSAAKLAASLLTGLDAGVLDTAWRSLNGSPAQREAYLSALNSTDAVDIIPQGIENTIIKLRENRSNAFNAARSQLDLTDAKASASEMDAFRSKMEEDLSSAYDVQFNDVVVKEGGIELSSIVDEGGSPFEVGRTDPVTQRRINFDEAGGLNDAPASVRSQLNQALDRAFKSDGSLVEMWKARQSVDRLGERAMNASASKVEGAMFGKIRSNITDLLDELGGDDFKALNAEYRKASILIDDFTAATNAKGGRQAQIDAVEEAIGQRKTLDESALNAAEAGGGNPLSSTAAGSIMGGRGATGLIGKNRLAQAVFAGTAVVGDPSLLAGLLFTSPKMVGKTMQALSLGKKAMLDVSRIVQKITNLPGAAPLIEQGLTFGAILEQLNREQPQSLFGQIGNAVNSR